ncbi:hypothetical protein A0H81_05523 [Grifola frondosa]|uniref:Uncharacterized protein n=1 Tax=Grifola frondosa TaxID=5627 RepID=A0A1C7MEJ1_GRIFR|nr:hypothetical protein A0H81_05523 [Grifola frondosa]
MFDVVVSVGPCCHLPWLQTAHSSTERENIPSPQMSATLIHTLRKLTLDDPVVSNPCYPRGLKRKREESDDEYEELPTRDQAPLVYFAAAVQAIDHEVQASYVKEVDVDFQQKAYSGELSS